jgi:hypothetical protein
MTSALRKRDDGEIRSLSDERSVISSIKTQPSSRDEVECDHSGEELVQRKAKRCMFR